MITCLCLIQFAFSLEGNTYYIDTNAFIVSHKKKSRWLQYGTPVLFTGSFSKMFCTWFSQMNSCNSRGFFYLKKRRYRHHIDTDAVLIIIDDFSSKCFQNVLFFFTTCDLKFCEAIYSFRELPPAFAFDDLFKV